MGLRIASSVMVQHGVGSFNFRSCKSKDVHDHCIYRMGFKKHTHGRFNSVVLSRFFTSHSSSAGIWIIRLDADSSKACKLHSFFKINLQYNNKIHLHNSLPSHLFTAIRPLPQCIRASTNNTHNFTTSGYLMRGRYLSEHVDPVRVLALSLPRKARINLYTSSGRCPRVCVTNRPILVIKPLSIEFLGVDRPGSGVVPGRGPSVFPTASAR